MKNSLSKLSIGWIRQTFAGTPFRAATSRSERTVSGTSSAGIPNRTAPSSVRCGTSASFRT